ncbi:MAG: FKBP-type peptidyl-prolyl cis-trans isomerase 2 [Gammaproteobacteria bacterium]|jgi:FKBP-type peptidyl-prolyl cis-trans isomerase 2
MKVRANDKVSLACIISHNLRTLEQFTESHPLEVQLGEQNLPVPIEMMIIGQEVGQRFKLPISVKDNVYGAIDAERIKSIPIEQFNQSPNVGELINFTTPNGQSIEGQVVNKNNRMITVDFNHPYAGRDLLFEVQLLKIL